MVGDIMAQLIKAVIDTQKNSYRSIGQVNAADDLELELEVKMNGQPIEFINPECELLIKKSDNNKVRQTKDIIYKDGKFKIKVDEQGVTYPGIVTCQLLTREDGRVSTCLFYFMVGTSLDREVLQSISKVEVLEELDEYVATAFANLDEYEKRIISADETIRKLNDDMNEAEKIRGASELERQETFKDLKENMNATISNLESSINLSNLNEKERSEVFNSLKSDLESIKQDLNTLNTNITLEEGKRVQAEINRVNKALEIIEKLESTNNSVATAEAERVTVFNDIKSELTSLKEALTTINNTANSNEEVRKENEVGRVAAEQQRQDNFNSMKLENDNFKKGINEQYDNIVTEFDKVIANVTNGNENATNSEIVQARGKEVNLNARLDNFDEQLDNKAKQSDLIVERKRIDNLTTLPKGSTMGDAELMDGRIGLGGKIFNNIGAAIRSQFGYINEKSNDLTFNYISGNNETSNLINYVSYYKKGYYVHSNGTENSNSDFAISELIPVTPLATCRFKILSDDATSVQHTGVILDKNGQYIQPLTKLDSITDITEKEIILPSNAYFVRVNLRIGFNKSYFKIVGTKELKWLRICKENLKDDVFFEKNLPWNGKKVTIYSDSLAQINDWAGNTLSWVSFLKEYCGFSEVVNKGIGGTTITPGTREGKTNDFYTRITTQNDIGTHLFIIFGGMNDYLFNSVIGSPNEAPGNTTLCNSVKSICEHIQTRYPESQILFILPPYGVPEPTTTNTIKEVSKAIEESVEDYGVEILNLTKYGDITVKNSAQKSLYYYDGIHYNDKGHERIAKNKIIPKVNSMLIRN